VEYRGVRSGFISQQLKDAMQAVPGVVDAAFVKPDADDDTPSQGINYSQLIAPLYGAIQALTARVAALEGK
jgi:hypothetical protein